MTTGRKASADMLGLALAGRTTAGSERPSIEVARRRLGGHATTPSAHAPGSLVEVALRRGPRALGVLLWATNRHCDVWFEDGVARRTDADAVTYSGADHASSAEPARCGHAGSTPGSTLRSIPGAALLRVAAEMRLFLPLAEGDWVRWERSAAVAEGRIVEKCRYGAIVAMGDGTVVAVGFRKLWPAKARGLA
jgi:hypothetical protein